MEDGWVLGKEGKAYLELLAASGTMGIRRREM